MKLRAKNSARSAKAANGTRRSGEVLVVSGGAVKSLGDGKYRAPLVTFSDPKDAADRDITGEFFTKSTDFWREWPSEIPVIYAHGQDPVMKARRLGQTGKATLSADDAGVWMEGQLDLADQYEAAINTLIVAGKMGTSSGSAEHLVEKSADGEILSWPLVEASLTPCPAEPRNRQGWEIKSLSSVKASLLGTFGNYWYGDDWNDGDGAKWDPAEEMTAAAGWRLHDRFCTAFGNIVRAKKLDREEKIQALRAVIAEYGDMLEQAATALLSIGGEAGEGEDDDEDVEDALAVLKAMTGQRFRPGTMKDFERLLRDAGGFSRTEATAIASTGFKGLRSDSGASNGPNIDDLRAQVLADSVRLDSRSLNLKAAALGVRS